MGLFFHYPYPQTHGFLKPALKSTFLINMSHNIINWICSNWNKLHVTNFRLKLVITCSFYASLLMYWLSFTWWIIFYVDVSGYGKPVGYPKPAWVWVWAKFHTRHGYGFFNGRIFLRGYGFGQVIPSGFLPVAISRHTGHCPVHHRTVRCAKPSWSLLHIANCHTRISGHQDPGANIITRCARTKSHTYDDSWHRIECHIITT